MVAHCDCPICSWLTEINQNALVHALSDCRNMTQFAVGGTEEFPAEILATIVRQHPRLEAIEACPSSMGRAALLGFENDIVSLASSLRNHSFDLESCSLSLRLLGPQTRGGVDSLLQALLELPSMKTIEFMSNRCIFPPVGNDKVTFVSTLQVSKVRVLKVVGVTETTAIAMFEALGANVHLEELCLMCRHETGHIVKLDCPGLRSASNLIRSNRSLKILDLGYASEDTDPQALAELITALEKSPTIQDFEIITEHRCDCQSRVRQATTDMLQNNVILKRFFLGWTESEMQDSEFYEEVQLYLQLNKTGRGSVHATSPSRKTELVKVLAACKGDISCLFYYLSNYPSLFLLTDPIARSAFAATEGNARKRRRLYRSAKYNGVLYRY